MARRIDPYSLQLLVSAAKVGSIARAAVIEHIAPSAFSRRIADLESVFGVALLVRSSNGIKLTESGKIAVGGGAKLDQDMQLLVREVQSKGGAVCGKLRLFANASAIVGVLPERLKIFCTKYPNVEIALHEHISKEIIQSCLDHSCNIGVGVAMNVTDLLDSWHFAFDPLSVVLPRGHELGKKAKLRYAEVISYPLVSILTYGALDRLLHDQAAAYNTALKVSVSVTSFDAVCRMVEAGLGIAVIPGHAAAASTRAGRIISRPLEENWSNRELRLYALHNCPRPQGVEEMIVALNGQANTVMA